MTSLPKISIIIPLYNVEEYIVECLESVARQTYQGKIECIIVDDCGTDKSLSITEQFISDYEGKIDFKLVHHAKNRGLSAARNTGVEHASGDYIYFLDSDDYISDDCIEVLAEPLKNKEYDMVIGDYRVIGNDWGVPKLFLTDGEYLVKEDILTYYTTGKIYMMAWNKLCSKSFILQSYLLFPEGILHEDDYWSFTIFSKLQKLYIVSSETYNYRIRNNGIMNGVNYTIKNRDGYQETLLVLARFIGRNAAGNSLHEWLNNRYLKLIVQISNENNLSFWRIYQQLREVYSYPIISKVKNKEIKKGKFIIRLHYLMPPYLGYVYLKNICKYLGYDRT